MICPRCGKENKEDTAFCIACGQNLKEEISSSEDAQGNTYTQQPMPNDGQVEYSVKGIPVYPVINNYMIWSILSTILSTVFCCLPIGVGAIIYSAQVDTLLARGNYQGALNASRNAKIWNIVTLVIGLVWIVMSVGLVVTGVLAAVWASVVS